MRVHVLLIVVSICVIFCTFFGLFSITSSAIENAGIDRQNNSCYELNSEIAGINLSPIISNDISDISIPIRISFDNTDVISYSIETDGLTAVEVSSGSMEYDIVAIDEYGTFDIYATYTDDIVVKSSVYTYQSGNAVYCSKLSKEHALEKYLEYAILNNIYTLEEAEVIWSGFSCESENVIIETEIPDPLNPSMETHNLDRGTICGTLQWSDDKGISHYLQRVRVDIYRKGLIGNVYVDTTYTNNWGYFEKKIGEYEDVFIRVYAGDGNITVGSPIHQWWYAITFDETDQLYDINAGEVTTVNLPTITMQTDVGKAIQIAQAALIARDYAWIMMNEKPNSVGIIYPYDFDIEDTYDPTNDNGCFYNSNLKIICITGRYPSSNTYPTSYASWDVIMHEYGHHIQNELNINDSIGSGHSSGINMADHYKDHYVNNSFLNCGINCVLNRKYIDSPSLILQENECKREGDSLAWGEAWPTVFGIMAQNYYSYYLTNIDTVANTLYQSYNGNNYDIESANVTYGEACERSIMAILLDIFDSSNDANDNIYLGHQAFWDLSTIEGTYTFSDFMEIFYEEYPQYMDDIAPNLARYKMATTKPIVSGAASINNPITISWTAQGGSTHYSNNLFTIVFYKNGVEVFRKENITTTNYTFTSSEWQQLLSNVEYVCGETLNIQIAIAAYQDDGNSYTTGPYYSERENLSLQFNHNYEPYNSCYEKCSYCNNKHQIASHDYTNDYEYYNTTQHTSYCACGAFVLRNHTYQIITEGQLKLDACIYCVGERNHEHSYTYTPCNDGKTHHTSCGCGISNYEQCFGIAGDGNTGWVRCLKCNQRLSGNIIIPLEDDDDDENDVMFFKEDGIEEKTE